MATRRSSTGSDFAGTLTVSATVRISGAGAGAGAAGGPPPAHAESKAPNETALKMVCHTIGTREDRLVFMVKHGPARPGSPRNSSPVGRPAYLPAPGRAGGDFRARHCATVGVWTHGDVVAHYFRTDPTYEGRNRPTGVGLRAFFLRLERAFSGTSFAINQVTTYVGCARKRASNVPS